MPASISPSGKLAEAASTLIGSSAVHEAEAIGHAQYVTVHRQARNAERVAEDHIRRLAAHSGELDQRIHRRALRHRDADQDVGHADERLRFLPEEAGRVDLPFELGGSRPCAAPSRPDIA